MPQSFVDVDEYRVITSDTLTDSATVTARLEDALTLIEEYLDRKLEHGTYTESLEIWYEDGIGYVYPLATPLTGVPVSAAYEVDYGERRLRGVVGNPLLSTFAWTPGYAETSAISPYSRSRPDYATVVYDGGFTSNTIPLTLKQYLAYCARALIKRTPAQVMGMQSASVGDVSVTYPSIQSPLDALVPGMSLGLKPYKRKRIRF